MNQFQKLYLKSIIKVDGIIFGENETQENLEPKILKMQPSSNWDLTVGQASDSMTAREVYV